MRRFAVGVLAVFIAGIIFVSLTDSAEVCNYPYDRDALVLAGKTTINTEVARNIADKEKGLSGRSCIGKNQAMLFIFSNPSQYSFWMKDMKFPIDIVWLSSDHKVVKVQSNVSPSTYPETFTNEDPAQYILELKAGRANELNLKKDSQVQINYQ